MKAININTKNIERDYDETFDYEAEASAMYDSAEQYRESDIVRYCVLRAIANSYVNEIVDPMKLADMMVEQIENAIAQDDTFVMADAIRECLNGIESQDEQSTTCTIEITKDMLGTQFFTFDPADYGITADVLSQAKAAAESDKDPITSVFYGNADFMAAFDEWANADERRFFSAMVVPSTTYKVIC